MGMSLLQLHLGHREWNGRPAEVTFVAAEIPHGRASPRAHIARPSPVPRRRPISRNHQRVLFQ